MKILVTGGAGYIGSILVPLLLEKSYSVTVLDNFSFKQNSLAAVCLDKNFKILKGDVRDEALMKSILPEFDLIIPLAALVGAPICKFDPVGATTINRDAVMTMLKWMSKEQRLLIPTTNSGYGVGEAGVYCDENSPLKPLSRYGIDKVEVEKAILDRGNAISFRLATVFGMSPRMRIDLLVNDFTYRALNDRFIVLFEGHFKRNYIHVRDVARVFLHGIENFDRLKNEPYNVGLSNANLSKLELCAAIKKQLPSFYYVEAAVGEDPDKRNFIVSNKKIESTGFVPQYSLDEGITELIKGYTMIKNSQFANF